MQRFNWMATHNGSGDDRRPPSVSGRVKVVAAVALVVLVVGAAAAYGALGSEDTAYGTLALASENGGDFNTAVGYYALTSNTTGDYNTATGQGALFANTTGDYNTATGRSALNANTTGTYNTATGAGLATLARAAHAPGRPDSTFGGHGTVVTKPPGEGFGWFNCFYSFAGDAVLAQPDGKVVVAGRYSWFEGEFFALARYTSTGALDQTFGNSPSLPGGLGTPDACPSWFGRCRVTALARQGDGKLVAAGWSSELSQGNWMTLIALARYEPDGALDVSFGAGGIVHLSIGSAAGAEAILVQPDGKIVVAGDTWNGTDSDFALARFDQDGSPDGSFGTNGVVTTSLSAGDDHAYALALQADGKLVAAGTTDLQPSGIGAVTVVRYTAGGALDSTFGAGGVAATGLDSIGNARVALGLQADGGLVVATTGALSGKAKPVPHDRFVLARLTTTGTPDTAFGTDGLVATAVGPGESGGGALAIQEDGKIIVAGFAARQGSEPRWRFAVARYDPDGSLDAHFGKRGVTMTVIGKTSRAAAVTIQPDGRIVAAGTSYAHPNETWEWSECSGFALARYWP